MKRKHVLFLVGVSTALAVGVAVFLLSGGSNQNDPSGTSPPVSASQPPHASTPELPVYPPPNTKEFAQVLNGSNKTAQANLVLSQFRTADWSADDVVPDGMTLVIDEKFVSSGIVGQATGRFETSTGSIAHEFVIWFQYQDEHWLIWTFEEV
jgi:hypothetical protein